MRVFFCCIGTVVLLLLGVGLSGAQEQIGNDPPTADQQLDVAVSQSPSPSPARLSAGNLDQMVVLRSFEHQAADAKPLRVSSVALSPDGRTLASAGYDLLFQMDPTVKLWDLSSGLELATLSGHKGWILDLAFSPDGKEVATAGSDGTVRLWDASSGREVRSISWPQWVWADSVAFSPDGKVLASGGADGTVRTWDAATGTPLHVMGEPAWTWTYQVAFSPDGTKLVAGGWDGSVKVWNVAAATLAATFDQGSLVPTVAFAPDGKSVVSGSRDGKVKVWSLATGQEVRNIDTGSRVYHLGLSPDGDMILSALASSAGGESLVVWDSATGNRLRSFSGMRLWANSAAFSADGRLLAAGGDGGDVKVWGLTPQPY